MEKIIFIILLSFTIFNQIHNRNITRIPFIFYPTNLFFANQTHPLTSKYMSQIVIQFPIGTPSKTFNLSLNLNTFYSLFLSNQLPGIELNYFYNSSLSSTYNCTKRQKSYYQEDFDKAETFNDIVYFQDEEKNLNFSFNFLLIDGLGYGVPNEYYAPGMIGLRLKNENNYLHVDDIRFLYQIRKCGLAKTEVFYFDFDKDKNNDDNGYFVIGEDLFDDEENFLQIKVGYLYMPTLLTEWAFNFDAIYYGDTPIKQSLDALIKTENGLILGPTDYEYIIKQFFKNSTQCYSNHTKMGYATYRYYYCEKDFDENTMEDLKFELSSINYSFILHGSDLFLEENDKKYFKILFLFYQRNEYWYLGRDFLKKFRLRFDSERKLIYIPLNRAQEKDDDEPDEKLFYEKEMFWIILGLSIVTLGLIVFIIFCLKKYPRKKRMNEVDDDAEYDYKNTEDTERFLIN